MEHTFTLTQGDLLIPCKLSQPDFGGIRRIVLGVHGLGGSMDDAIQTAISEEMDLFYAATMRFDFPAHGESPLNSDFFSVENCKASLLAAARYAREQFPEVEDLCIFSTGFGAYVTLLSLEELLALPGRIRLVVQTPSILMHETLLAMKDLTPEMLREMGSVTMRSPRPLEVRYEVYEQMRENIAMGSYPIPMLILHSQDNAYIRMPDVQRFHRMNEGSKLVVVPGTTHQFLEAGAWDMVLDLTRDWFEFEQVLLSDYI